MLNGNDDTVPSAPVKDFYGHGRTPDYLTDYIGGGFIS